MLNLFQHLVMDLNPSWDDRLLFNLYIQLVEWNGNAGFIQNLLDCNVKLIFCLKKICRLKPYSNNKIYTAGVKTVEPNCRCRIFQNCWA